MGSTKVKGSKSASIVRKAPSVPQDAIARVPLIDPTSEDEVSSGGNVGDSRTRGQDTHGNVLAPARRTVPGLNGGTLAPWPPGVSGNPGGRHTTKPLEAALRHLVDGDAPSIARALVEAAKAGDVNAAKVVLETLYGKPTQRIEVDTFAKAYDVTMDVDNV